MRALGRLPPLAAFLRNLTGWRRVSAAALFGVFAALAFAPINAVPVFWVSFPALVFLLQGAKSMREAFIIGWAFAFGLMLLGLYWIAASMFVDIAAFWWAVPLSVCGLPLVFGLYYGAGMAVAWRIGCRGLEGVLTVALMWFLSDYVRGHAFSGFPWNLEGYGWSGLLPMLQITSVAGIYGLTLLTLIASCLPALLARGGAMGRWVVCASLLCLAACGFWGQWRLTEATAKTVPEVRLRLVQPNVDQALKWVADEREKNFEQLLDLSSQPGLEPVTHIIWPETAATFYLAEDARRRQEVAAHTPLNGSVLTGVIRRSTDENEHLHFYNSLIAIDSLARIDAGYDKHHLVPFGEYIPYRSVIPLRPLVNLGVDFTPGDGVRTLRVAGLPPFSPLVCYEVIFPGDVAAQEDRPEFLLNVTNDGWYGHTAGPYQHFASARVRSVEEGLPLVRAANTGISGVVDGYGRITAELQLGASGYLDADLPVALPQTFFSKNGDRPVWALFGFFGATAALLGLRKRK
ncbi:MAG: apolipoprotein N-acyltransferase [Pseudomonadota bacterium]|nr:apolipoprotein N-acyltransferase [Pseudomonadota bacterium]